MISGFTSTIFASGFLPKLTSITVMRMLLPICGAASPTPCAAYMLANISSASFSSSASNFVIVAAGFSSTGSRCFSIGYVLRAGASPTASGAAAVTASELVDLLAIAFEIAPHLSQRVSTKFLQKSIGQHKGYHGLARHPARRHHAPVGTLISGAHRLLGHHVRGP